MKDLIYKRWLPILGQDYIGQQSLVGIKEFVSAVEKNIEQGSLILDIGCGNGVVACYLSEQKGGSIIGIDINHENIKIAQSLLIKRKQNSYVSFFVKDFDNFDLPNYYNKFDFIYSIDVLQYSRDLSSCLKNINRFVKQNVFFYATIWCFNNTEELSQLSNDWGFTRTYDVSDIITAFESARYTIVKFEDNTDVFMQRCKSSLKSLNDLESDFRGTFGDNVYEARLSLERRTVENIKLGLIKRINLMAKI